MTPELEVATLSGATRGEPGREVLYTSGATRGLGQSLELRFEDRGHPGRSVPAVLRSVVVATMLPFSGIDELIVRRRFDAASVTGYVIYVGEGHERLDEAPSIVAVWPDRHTLRFRSQRPARRLPPRMPFISSTSLADDE